MRREYSNWPIVAVAALIFNDNGEILLVKRGAEPGKGLWSIPGGAVELGEKLEDALKREVLEETGLVIEPIELLDIAEIIKKDEEGKIKFHYITIDYIARRVGGELKPSSDALDAMWVRFEDLDKLKTTNTFKKIIRDNRDKILKYIRD